MNDIAGRLHRHAHMACASLPTYRGHAGACDEYLRRMRGNWRHVDVCTPVAIPCLADAGHGTHNLRVREHPCQGPCDVAEVNTVRGEHTNCVGIIWVGGLLDAAHGLPRLKLLNGRLSKVFYSQLQGE